MDKTQELNDNIEGLAQAISNLRRLRTCAELCPRGFACCNTKQHTEHRCDLVDCCNFRAKLA